MFFPRFSNPGDRADATERASAMTNPVMTTQSVVAPVSSCQNPPNSCFIFVVKPLKGEMSPLIVSV